MLISTRDLLDRYFESEHLKGLLTFFGMVSIWGGPSTPGTSYVYGHHSWGEFNGEFGQYGFVKGGMGGITEALASGRPPPRGRDPARLAGGQGRRPRAARRSGSRSSPATRSRRAR